MAVCIEKLAEQDALLRDLLKPAIKYAVICNDKPTVELLPIFDKYGKTITILEGGESKEICRPNFDVKDGDIVLISPMTSQVIGKAGIPEGNMIVTVKRVLSDTRCEVNIQSEPVVVFTGGHKLSDGDKVV